MFVKGKKRLGFDLEIKVKWRGMKYDIDIMYVLRDVFSRKVPQAKSMGQISAALVS